MFLTLVSPVSVPGYQHPWTSNFLFFFGGGGGGRGGDWMGWSHVDYKKW